MNCPHCNATRVALHHFTDAGTATPEEASAAGYCPVLARLRNLNTKGPIMEAPEPALPAGWRRHPSAALEELLDTIDDSTQAYEDVAYELDARYAAEDDSRVAQGIGAARGELPS